MSRTITLPNDPNVTFVHDDLMPRADQLDLVNKALLPVVRHFLTAFLDPQSMGWRAALAAAAGTWGEARGLAIANAVQIFLSAVLNSRSAPLDYSDPLDIDARLQLTSDEVDLLALIAMMRAEKTKQARMIATRLTGGHVEAAVVRAGLSLAVMLDPSAQKPAHSKKPTLMAVS
jgi:antitoxin component of RelBE/YafQ-DinJ toxin-antitoxin module